MIWLLAVIGIPIAVVLMLFFPAAADFWQIVAGTSQSSAALCQPRPPSRKMMIQ
ncbi:hypothetical protein [Acidithiobacillus sp.]